MLILAGTQQIWVQTQRQLHCARFGLCKLRFLPAIPRSHCYGICMMAPSRNNNISCYAHRSEIVELTSLSQPSIGCMEGHLVTYSQLLIYIYVMIKDINN